MKPPFCDVAKKAAIETAERVIALRQNRDYIEAGLVPNDEVTAGTQDRLLDEAVRQASIVIEHRGPV
jgi:hypothetical protein